jgi:hypothetical protein
MRVAPREITDLVYRSCRVVGLSAGVAQRCAANVTHGEIHRGNSVLAFLDALAQGDESVRSFASAADRLESVEATGRFTVAFDEPVALAALSASLEQAASRGFVPQVAATVPGNEILAGIDFLHHQVPDQARRDAVAREYRAMSEGLVFAIEQLQALESSAARFLVAESFIDSAVGE